MASGGRYGGKQKVQKSEHQLQLDLPSSLWEVAINHPLYTLHAVRHRDGYIKHQNRLPPHSLMKSECHINK